MDHVTETEVTLELTLSELHDIDAALSRHAHHWFQRWVADLERPDSEPGITRDVYEQVEALSERVTLMRRAMDMRRPHGEAI